MGGCQKCGSIIVGDGDERGGPPTSFEENRWIEYVRKAIREHHCSMYVAQYNGVKWPYYFADPRTLEQQWAAYINKAPEPINNPTPQKLKYLRCDGYKVFPDGTPCIGCPDCEREQNIEAQRITSPPPKDIKPRPLTVWDYD